MKNTNIIFTYMYQPPKRWTFEQKKLKKWIEDRCVGKTLNLFAGKTKLNISNEIRNDLNVKMNADYHMDAYDFVKMCIKKPEKFDTIILDPPYSLRKSMEKYFDFHISKWTKLKKIIPFILKDGGRIITLGYNSIGFGRGFIKKEICLVCHHNSVNDTIVLVEEKMHGLNSFKLFSPKREEK